MQSREETERIITEAVKSYSDAVYAFVNRIIGDHDISQDITQETFIKVFSHLANIKDLSRLQSYLFRTAFNTSMNYKRIEKKHAIDNYEEHIDLPLEHPHSLVSNNDITRDSELYEAIQKLSKKQQAVISFRFFGNMKIKAIADIMKVKESSVKVHLSRGLKNLKKVLKEKRFSYEV